MLLKLFGYSKSIPLHDHTDSRRSLRSIQFQRTGDPLGDPAFVTTVERVTDADERQRKTEDMLRLRRRWAGAAAALLFALLPARAHAARVLESVTTPGGGWVLEVADYGTPTQFELYCSPPVPRVRISQHLTGQGWDVNTGVVPLESPMGWRAAYLLTQVAYGVSDLYTVHIFGGSPHLITHLALPGFRRSGADRLLYAAQEIAGGPATWWSVDSSGNDRRPVLFADGFESGTTRAWSR